MEENNVMETEVMEANEATTDVAYVEDSEQSSGTGDLVLGIATLGLAAYGAFEAGKNFVVPMVKKGYEIGKDKHEANKAKRAEKKAAKKEAAAAKAAEKAEKAKAETKSDQK